MLLTVNVCEVPGIMPGRVSKPNYKTGFSYLQASLLKIQRNKLMTSLSLFLYIMQEIKMVAKNRLDYIDVIQDYLRRPEV